MLLTHYLHTSLPTYLGTSLPMYLTTYIPHYLCTSLPMYLTTYVPHYLRTKLPTYLTTYVPHYLWTSLLSKQVIPRPPFYLFSSFQIRYSQLPTKIADVFGSNCRGPVLVSIAITLPTVVPHYSVTRLDHFWKFLATNFLPRVTKIFCYFIGLFWNELPSSKS